MVLNVPFVNFWFFQRSIVVVTGIRWDNSELIIKAESNVESCL